MLTKPINTERFSSYLRSRVIDVAGRRLLISRLAGSEQEVDLTVPANCRGLGRVHHFRQASSPGWPSNPLPVVPACEALCVRPIPQMMLAQVFQNAGCAWRCWYCFVPSNLLNADPKRSAWITAEELVDLYEEETCRPPIIDLSGGSPDLVPEWVPWMMEALEAHGLHTSTYLWSDDNLSTALLFDRLRATDIDRMCSYRSYGRVCCFKGYDHASFAFNTRASESDFDRQFEIMGRLLQLGLDLYGYVTLTSPHGDNLEKAIPAFVDRLQVLDPNLPLRVVPLQIREFSPVKSRMSSDRERSLVLQETAIGIWNSEIERRFDSKMRELSIASVPLRYRKCQP